MKQKNDYSLAEAMQAMLKEYHLGSQLNEMRVKTLWADLMGKTINTYTSQIAVRKGVLYISISSAALRHELSYGKDKIRDLLNAELGVEYIKEVVIR